MSLLNQNNVNVTGNYVALSTEPKPTQGVQDGNTLFLVDTKKAFIWYKGEWREV